jgi:hypothetical protein
VGYQFSSQERLYKARSLRIGSFLRQRSNQAFSDETFLRKISLILVSSSIFHPGNLAPIAASTIKSYTREYNLGPGIILLA